MSQVSRQFKLPLIQIRAGGNIRGMKMNWWDFPLLAEKITGGITRGGNLDCREFAWRENELAGIETDKLMKKLL